MTEDVEKPQSQLLEETGSNEAVETVEALASVPSPPLRDHEQQREKIASWIAMGLFSLFAFTVIAPLVCFMWGGCLDHKVIAYVEAGVIKSAGLVSNAAICFDLNHALK